MEAIDYKETLRILEFLRTFPRKVGRSRRQHKNNWESNGLIFVNDLKSGTVEIYACTDPEGGFYDPFDMPNHEYVQTMIVPKKGEYICIYRDGLWIGQDQEEWKKSVHDALEKMEQSRNDFGMGSNVEDVLNRALAAQKRLNSET